MAIKLTFVSNYLTIHQIAICREFFSRENVDFKFVSSYGPSSEKAAYSNFENENFVLRAYESNESFEICKTRINESDAVIFGSGNRKLISKYKNLLFFYTEHLSKTPITLLRKIHLKMLYGKYRKAYLLCASHFASEDYNSIGLFRNRCLHFGYFPLMDKNDFEKDYNRDYLKVLWVGRELDWKHPEYAFYCARVLHDCGIKYKVTMVTTKNNLVQNLLDENREKEWLKNIEVLNQMPNSEVQKLMKESDIFLGTSDKNEGWGAVVNEAMNAKCCPIVSSLTGCACSLIENNKNGLLFNDINDFENKIKYAIENERYKQLGKEARETISAFWNEKNAVDNILKSVECIISKREFDSSLINKGPGTKVL